MSTPSSKIGHAVDLHVAQRLRAARKESGVSQEAAAAHVDLSFQQIQKYENGKNRISPGKLAALAELYGKSVAWFFPEAGNGKPGRDLPAELLAAPGGAELARDYLAIEDGINRQLVVTVAAAFARNGAGHA